VNGIDPGIARLLESEGGKDEFEEAGDYKEEIASGLSYSSDWVGKVYRSWRGENRHTEIVPKQNPPADD